MLHEVLFPSFCGCEEYTNYVSLHINEWLWIINLQLPLASKISALLAALYRVPSIYIDLLYCISANSKGFS
jgi:hypothetical protein